MDERATRIRIADVAREAGVSKTAVSFAFNSPGRLRPETATRILEIAELLGYRPNPVARMLTQRRTMTIGVVTPKPLSISFSNPYFGAFAEGVALAAEQSGYGLHFISPLHGSLARAVDRATVDGVVAIGLHGSHPEVEELQKGGLPFVLVDSSALPDLPSVDVDDEGGARAAADHLVDLGHREFLVVGVEPPSSDRGIDPGSVTACRLRGYRTGLASAGIELGDDRVVLGPATVDAGFAAFVRAWSTGIRPTAVLAMSDAMAIGALRAVREQGLRVPADVSVVGFDDIDLAPHIDPPLTTIHQPVRRKGEEAVRLLLASVSRRDRGRTAHLRLGARLIIRSTTGPAPRPARRSKQAG
ncbi:MAG TPA: LacI family DNA-binding transcriptional regulator [Candidatus Limnocylindrales bacterium]|jgi:alanine racemase